MASKFFGEFMGTMILILMGNGVVANMLLKRSKAEGAGWMAITAGWAFAVMTRRVHRDCVRQSGRASESGGDAGRAPCSRAISRMWRRIIAAQMLGAMAGAVLVWLNFLPHWA